MKILLASSFALCALASVTFAQQPPAPPTNPPATQAQPPQPVLPLTPIPQVMNSPANEPTTSGRDAPPPHPPGSREAEWRRHDGHRPPPPPPPSKAAHFRIEDGQTKIDAKCADDEPTKVCADVLMKIMDKLSPSSDAQGDEQD